MKLTDKVYGTFEVTEPLLLELLQTTAVQRLKNISQYGVPNEFHHKNGYSRYDHSLGVMLLLRLLGASQEEQAAGLLHDTSHTAFSHVADWIFGQGRDGNESYQDNYLLSYLERTEVPTILENHNLSLDSVVENQKHTLLETDLPDICADRIDYTLRELVQDGENEVVEHILDSLVVSDNRIAFRSNTNARLFADRYLHLQRTNWGSKQATIRYELLADAFTLIVEKGLLTKQDFWGKSEDELINILTNSNEPEIKYSLVELAKKEPKLKTPKTAVKKNRYVDPLIIDGKKVVRLSDLDTDYKSIISELEGKQYLKIVLN